MDAGKGRRAEAGLPAVRTRLLQQQPVSRHSQRWHRRSRTPMDPLGSLLLNACAPWRVALDRVGEASNSPLSIHLSSTCTAAKCILHASSDQSCVRLDQPATAFVDSLGHEGRLLLHSAGSEHRTTAASSNPADEPAPSLQLISTSSQLPCLSPLSASSSECRAADQRARGTPT